ncbi:MAG TPA: amidohydrolase family protein [Sphingomicrobium sp.]|nr:amidohydrolase family protein [Sphingomicrobium sp.]
MHIRGALIAAVMPVFLIGAAAPVRTVDLLIRGGLVYTGSAAPFVGDVAISGDRIKAVGRRLRVAARTVIDAKGKVVAPGFIDPHTHAGKDLGSDEAHVRLVPAFLLQGVTTAFIGNDGAGDAEVGAVLGRASAKPVGVNFAAFVGFGAVRTKVVGEADRAPTPDELARMRAMVAKAMCEGAVGFSTGLFYAPQSFAKTGEVAALAREAGSRDGVYDSHIRDESSYNIGLVAAIDEALAIGREARIRVNISHIKALGVDVEGQAPLVIARIEAARRAGQRVTADQYPWSASGTTLVGALIPLWAQAGGRDAMVARFDDAGLGSRLRAGISENLRKRGGAGAMLITVGDHKGRTLAEVAGQRGEEPVAAVISLVRQADAPVASFNQSERDIKAFMRRPWVMTGSDGTLGHPRMFGSFVRKYAKYVVAERVLTPRQFIERSTALTAASFGVMDRGRLVPGAFADVVVFDPRRFAARATYEQPELPAVGVRSVIVNGVLAVHDGKLTGRAAGRALRHIPTPGRC